MVYDQRIGEIFDLSRIVSPYLNPDRVLHSLHILSSPRFTLGDLSRHIGSEAALL